MTIRRRSRCTADIERCRVMYVVELARGGSHIASTLTEATLQTAVAEVVNEFLQQHGKERLSVFRELLADRLDERQRPEAASAVRRFGMADNRASEERHSLQDERRALRHTLPAKPKAVAKTRDT